MKKLLAVLLIASTAVARVVTAAEIVNTTAAGIAVDGFNMRAGSRAGLFQRKLPRPVSFTGRIKSSRHLAASRSRVP